jgi:plasmid stabilization system protein ParE
MQANNMRYQITRHPLVRSDLANIVTMIGEYAGYTVAQNKFVDLEKTIRNLQDYPHTGTLRGKVRVIPAAVKGVICFQVDDVTRTVFVVCVTYAGADWESRVQARM